jgi:iron complex transport system ATP-binding protein
MVDPPLLILDEPCAGLDPVARQHFLQFLQKLAGRKKAPTLILVTHHVEEVMPAFSHVMLLKDGRILAQGHKADALTSELLSRAFGSRIQLQSENGRYTMSILAKLRAVM